MQDIRDPESPNIMAQRLCTHQSEAILFTYMLKLYSYVISHFENYINYTDMSKSIGLRGLERIHPYAC